MIFVAQNCHQLPLLSDRGERFQAQCNLFNCLFLVVPESRRFQQMAEVFQNAWYLRKKKFVLLEACDAAGQRAVQIHHVACCAEEKLSFCLAGVWCVTTTKPPAPAPLTTTTGPAAKSQELGVLPSHQESFQAIRSPSHPSGVLPSH